MIYNSYRFDDGDITQYDIAFNNLKILNQVGSFYIITDKIGYNGFMTLENLKEIYKNGNNIGSHSCSHKDNWINSNYSNIKKEIVDSKIILRNLGFKPKIFCFPKMIMNNTTEILAKNNYNAYFKNYSTNRIQKLNKNYIPSYPTKFGIKELYNLIEKKTCLDVWLVITFHKITNYPTEYDITPEQFVNILLLVDKGIRNNTHKNLTVEDGFKIFFNQSL